MDEKQRVQIKLPDELSSAMSIDNVSYIVQTEDMGAKDSRAVTRIYLEGKIVFSKKTTYPALDNTKDKDVRLRAFLEQHHRAAADEFVREKAKSAKTKKEYFEDAVRLLRRGGGRAALGLIKEGLDRYPGAPFLYSYCGCLTAIAGKDPLAGIKICTEALSLLEKSMPFGSEFFYPFFYLNLGRAYLAADDRASAIKAFHTGLKADPENKDLLWEWKKLGVRRKPPVPFLKRGNPINKYVGLLLGREKK